MENTFMITFPVYAIIGGENRNLIYKKDTIEGPMHVFFTDRDQAVTFAEKQIPGVDYELAVMPNKDSMMNFLQFIGLSGSDSICLDPGAHASQKAIVSDIGLATEMYPGDQRDAS